MLDNSPISRKINSPLKNSPKFQRENAPASFQRDPSYQDMKNYDKRITSDEFSPNNAAVFVALSRLSYREADCIQDVTQTWNLTFSKFFIVQKTDTSLFVVYTKDTIIVVFRGTESRVNVITDLDATMKSTKNFGYIHTGFDEALDSIYGELVDHIKSIDPYSVKKLILVGHSLGGALAILFATRLAQNDEQSRVQFICTFGSPKVGDSTFAAKFDSFYKERTYRFVNHEDIVPRILLLSYTHVGKLMYFDYQGTLSIDAQEAPLSYWEYMKAYSLSWKLYFEKFSLLPESLQDHRIKNYQKNVLKWAMLK